MSVLFTAAMAEAMDDMLLLTYYYLQPLCVLAEKWNETLRMLMALENARIDQQSMLC